MLLKACQICVYCEKKLKSGYCTKEECSPFVTRCIQRKALEFYFKENQVKVFKSLKKDGSVDM